MTNPYTGYNPPYGEGDYAGLNYPVVRAIRDEACRTGGEDDFVLMTRAQADVLLDGYNGPESTVVDEVNDGIVDDEMWEFMHQFLIHEIDPDDEETEERISDALDGPVLDAMVATAVRDQLSPAAYDVLVRPWRLHCEREGLSLDWLVTR